ncbi:MAG: SlyX family protein [Myxococcota bacterium]
MTTEQRLIELEIKLAYQERTVDTLNEVILELRSELGAQAKRLTVLEARLVALVADDGDVER